MCHNCKKHLYKFLEDHADWDRYLRDGQCTFENRNVWRLWNQPYDCGYPREMDDPVDQFCRLHKCESCSTTEHQRALASKFATAVLCLKSAGLHKDVISNFMVPLLRVRVFYNEGKAHFPRPEVDFSDGYGIHGLELGRCLTDRMVCTLCRRACGSVNISQTRICVSCENDPFADYFG